MAKKQITEADVKKMRDIEAYTHDSKKRSNNPPAGMAHHDKSAETTNKDIQLRSAPRSDASMGRKRGRL